MSKLTPEQQQARMEDYLFLRDNGEVPERIAERLGLSMHGLKKWCYLNGLALRDDEVA